jgi:hypothetical protein
MLYFKAKIAKHGKMKNDKDEIWNIHISPKKTGPLMEMSRTASAHDQSLRCLPNCFSLKIKDTRDINEVIILILGFHAHCFYKVNNNITQRRKSFVKSKMLTDKVRSPVPDNISVQRPKNMIKPATRTGQKYFPTKIFPYIFHIKPFISKTFAWSHSYLIFKKCSALNAEINIVSSSRNFQLILFLLSLFH